MARPIQLFVSTLVLLLSCNSKDKEKANWLASNEDTIYFILKQAEINQSTVNVIEKLPVAYQIKKTTKVNTQNSNHQNQISLKVDFKQIENEFQKFVINTNFDTTIVCNEGTVMKIKHSSFLISSNLTEAKGTIIIQVKEFYKISDILSARLTTHSNDNILETSGMLFIQATSDGQLCKLKDNSPIEISFPFKEKKDSMLLFSGCWKNQKINWELITQNESYQKEMVEEIAIFPGGSVALNNFILMNLVYPDYLADIGIGGIIQMEFVIDETGKAKDVNFKNPSQKGFKHAILKAISKMPIWKPAKQNGVPIKSTFSQTITFYSEEQNMNDTIFKNNFEAAINDTNINKVNTADIRHYIFSTSKLGWINCDRFYNNPKPRTDFYVDCGDYTELDIKLVFHSFKAILDNLISKPTSKFQNIPNDEPVTVVIVKKLNNEIFISLTKSNTNLKSIKNLVFEKVNMNKLKHKLKELNKLW